MAAKIKFPYIALFLGAFLWVAVILGAQIGPDERTYFPLLTLLLISEFAFFVTIIGGIIMLKEILMGGFKVFRLIVCFLCLLLSIEFLRLGLYFWPN